MRPLQERGSRPPLTAGPDQPQLRTTASFVGVAAVVVALDQLTKWWATRTLDDRTIDLVWTLRLQLTFNRGASFGVGEAFGPLIAIVGVVVVVLLVRAGRLMSSPLVTVGVGMLLGGALGNLADRAFRAGDGFLGGAVVDFIDLQWWPVFNVADAAIVVGAIVVVLFGRVEP